MRTAATTPSSVEALNELLGKPPLIRGEDEQQYWRLHAAFEDQIQPVNIFDMFRIRDLTDKIWEQRRNKNSMAALTEASLISALTDLLQHRMRTPSGLPEPSILYGNIARAYFNRTTTLERKKELEGLLAEHGITVEQIHAKAMEHCGPSLTLLKNFDYRDDKLIRRSLKDQEQVAAKRAKQKSDNSEPES